MAKYSDIFPVNDGGYNLPAISDIFCWYDNRSIVSFPTNQVVALLDLSGSANNASIDTTGYRPTFIQNGINSLPTTGYSGARTELITPPFGVNCETTDWSIVTCCKIPILSDGTYRGVITNRPYGVSDRWFTFGAAFNSGTSVPNAVAVESRHSTNGVTNVTSSYISQNTFSIYAIVKSTTSFNVYRNGSSIISSSINIGGGTDATRPWRIGIWFSDNQSLGGDIASLSIYKKALSTIERNEVEFYLNSKYNVY